MIDKLTAQQHAANLRANVDFRAVVEYLIQEHIAAVKIAITKGEGEANAKLRGRAQAYDEILRFLTNEQ